MSNIIEMEIKVNARIKLKCRHSRKSSVWRNVVAERNREALSPGISNLKASVSAYRFIAFYIALGINNNARAITFEKAGREAARRVWGWPGIVVCTAL